LSGAAPDSKEGKGITSPFPSPVKERFNSLKVQRFKETSPWPSPYRRGKFVARPFQGRIARLIPPTAGRATDFKIRRLIRFLIFFRSIYGFLKKSLKSLKKGIDRLRVCAYDKSEGMEKPLRRKGR